ncbi:hypothetical protein C7M84_000034 [Penaeus vannamei]|uniref:Uncharacterized protein n=1 Tax=Penaeus vannamei TaxID=6689 RepID=A0A3R7MGN5_PENVA|nr:hypothetical protein C7M84_000034 [Penaeus vannamei]
MTQSPLAQDLATKAETAAMGCTLLSWETQGGAGRDAGEATTSAFPSTGLYNSLKHDLHPTRHCTGLVDTSRKTVIFTMKFLAPVILTALISVASVRSRREVQERVCGKRGEDEEVDAEFDVNELMKCRRREKRSGRGGAARERE